MFPTTGTWLNFIAWNDGDAKIVHEMNPEQLMGIIKKVQADGGRVYPYARQIRYWYAYHEDRPPLYALDAQGKARVSLLL